MLKKTTGQKKGHETNTKIVHRCVNPNMSTMQYKIIRGSGGREVCWANVNIKTLLTLLNYNLIYTLPHTIGIKKIIQI